MRSYRFEFLLFIFVLVTIRFYECMQFSKMVYQTIERGSLYSSEYRVFLKDERGLISPLHDIPLFANVEKKIYNMVVEIPRWTNAKMEINLAEPLNPIKQDIKKGVPRFVPNCFPHHGYIWNYGALPQTWEDPNVIDENTKCKGDNDPIDALEIGFRVAKRGEVLQVKVLGAVALIDEGETDWKIITIDVNDPVAEQVNNLTDIEKNFPGLLKATVEWFRIYKIPDGKPENQFAFNGEAKGPEFAQKIVSEVHTYWKRLVSKEVEASNISPVNTSLNNTSTIGISEAEALSLKAPEATTPQIVNPTVDKWHFIHLKY
ncbi:inorganic pyrophosphatase-like isoform X1 [Planococcus citri]|uniref:inorganic pyrophosphatase-like isoform X1 n=2 Tax=Planococcus citri TaxID=170843 RepID=UPI0031F83E13